MAYTPTTWSDGDVITAEKMNKLEQGVKNEQAGAPGAAAGFGTPTATVDANVGTPSVTVTASGSNTEKVFNFAFKNLKGVKGDPGASYTLPAASKTALGGVKQVARVNEAAGENVTKAEFKALLDALKASGIMASA